jgi:hypothetical protein
MTLTLRRVSGVLIGLLGAGLFGWLLYDASAIASTLRLSNVMSEAVAAVLTMIVAAACIATFLRLVLRTR